MSASRAALAVLGLVGLAALAALVARAEDPAPTDALGDPLPRGAVARLGTARFHQADEVAGLAFSPDGTRLVSLGRDRATVWDRDGRALRALGRGASRDEQVSFLPSGDVVLSGERSIRRLALDGTTVASLESGSPFGVAAVTTGEKSVAVAQDRTVALLDLATGNLVARFEGPRDRVRGLALSPDGKWLACAARDARVRVFALATGQPVHVFDEAAHAVAFLGDGRTLATVSYERVRFLDLRSGDDSEAHRPIEADRIAAAAFSPDGTLVALTCQEPRVRVFETRSGAERHVLAGHRFVASALAFSPDGGTLASGDREGTICLFSVESGRELEPLARHKGKVLAVALSPDGKRVATAGNDLSLRFWETATGRLEGTVPAKRAVQSMALSPDGTVLVFGQPDGSARLVAVPSGKELGKRDGGHGSLDAVAWSPDGKRLAVGGRDGSVHVHEGETHAFELTGHEGGITGLAFSPDGARLASAGMDRTVFLWDPAKGTNVGKLAKQERLVDSVAFSPSGESLATTSMDRIVRLFTLDGKEHLRLGGHGVSLAALAFSPEGKRLAAGGSDRVVRVFSLEGGKELAALPGHAGPVTSLAFDRAGERLVSGSADGTALVWDARAWR